MAGVTVRGIEVKEDGALRIGLRTDAYAGNWMKLDNLNLVRETNQETPYEFLKCGRYLGTDLAGRFRGCLL